MRYPSRLYSSGVVIFASCIASMFVLCFVRFFYYISLRCALFSGVRVHDFNVQGAPIVPHTDFGRLPCPNVIRFCLFLLFVSFFVGAGVSSVVFYPSFVCMISA